MILPEISNFQMNCAELESTITAYSNNTTTENLEKLRIQWCRTAQSYGRIYVFNIGTIKDRFFNLRLYDWPSSTGAINSNLNNYDAFDLELIQSVSIGASSKSIPGIEYLIYESQSLTEVNSKFLNQKNRLEYLMYASKALNIDASELKNIWSPTGRNYADDFIYNDNTSIDGSFNQLYNGINNLIEVAKIKKLSKPAGLGKSINTDPRILQAGYSRISKEILSENLNIIEELFFSTSGLNISDYLNFKSGNNELSIECKEKLSTCKDKINALDVSLREAIDTDKTEVEEIFNSFEDLSELLAVDVKFAFSITITPVDTDGD